MEQGINKARENKHGLLEAIKMSNN